MKWRRMLLAAIFALAASAISAPAADRPATAASDPQPQIREALKAYQAGHVQDAIDALQKAIAILQESQRQGLAAFFPKAPPGWKAGELQSNSLSSGGSNKENSFSYTTLTQQYTRESDQLTVTLTLANSPQLISGFNGMMQAYKNPQVLASMNQNPDTHITLVDQDGWKGWSVLNKDQNAQITAFNGAYLLTLQVSKDDQSVLDTFWKKMNLKGLNAQNGKSTPSQ